MIVLDVKKKEVLSFGVFGAGEWLSANQKPEKLDNYGKAMVYYFNMPTDETMRKKALASAASFVTTYVINVFLNTGSSMATSAIGIPMGGGLQLGAEFKFEYNLDDVTWQQYGPTYFDDNYGWKQSEYLQAVSQ